LRVPITGAMFHPHRAGFPEPFPGGPDWMYIRCRYCRTRPFLRDDEVLTTDGLVNINDEKLKDPALLFNVLEPITGGTVEFAAPFIVDSPIPPVDVVIEPEDSITIGPSTEAQVAKGSPKVSCPICGREYHNTPKGLHWYNKHIEACNA